MAGTLTVGTLSDGTNTTSATNSILGAAKVRGNWVGSSTTVNSSFNLSSVTRNATGDYTMNYASSLTNSYNSYAGTCFFGSASSGTNMLLGGYPGSTPTASAVRLGQGAANTPSFLDMAQTNCSVFGNG